MREGRANFNRRMGWVMRNRQMGRGDFSMRERRANCRQRGVANVDRRRGWGDA